MVAIKAFQANAFVKSPPLELRAVLFFGTDPGMVSDRASALAATLAAREEPKGEILRIDDAELDDDPGRLEVELKMRPLFSGRQIVRATAGRRISAAALKPILADDEPLEGLLIVEAGNLKSDDAMRTLFERGASLHAVACYPDSAADIETLAIDVLRAHGLEIDADALALLQSRLGADRALSRSEIEKLALYCAGRRDVTIADVEATVGDAAEFAIERIAEAAADGRGSAAVTDFGRANALGEDAQLVILALQRYFLRLHKVRSDVDAGQRLDEALKSMRPPLFFKQRDAFVRQVQRWPRTRLDAALRRIGETARQARLWPAQDAVLAERLILALSAMAGDR
jgi:DNA polymerase-3 subunit delta